MGKISQFFVFIRKSEFLRSIFIRTVTVFLAVIALVLTVMFFSFGAEINKSTVSERKKRLEGVEDVISQRMSELISIAFGISEDPSFLLEPMSGDKYSGHAMSEKLSAYLVGNGFVRYLAYYRLSEPDRIYSSVGELSFSDFWEAYLDCDNYTELTYLDRIKKSSGANLISLASEGGEISYYTYVSPLPRFSTDPGAYVIAIIPYTGIESLLSALLVNSHGELTLYDSGRNVICRTSTLDFEAGVEPSSATGGYSESYLRMKGSRYVIQERVSGVNGWIYVSATRLGDINSQLAGTQVLLVVIVVILMLVAVWLILISVVKKYGPISELALTLKERSGQRHDGIIDEKSLLTSTVASLISDSEQKEKYEQAYIEASEANKAKSAFLSSMSHDIRTPMNAVIGMTELAIRHMDDTEYVRDCLEKVDTASHYLLDIINNVLDMSRIESGKLVLREDNVRLDGLIDGIGAIMRVNTDIKKQRLVVNTSGIRGDTVLADRVRLTQVFVNIVSNSVKFTPEGGTITMSAVREADAGDGQTRYIFEFSDTGIGMSPEFVDKVFDVFTRENESGSASAGTGLGMAIAKNLVTLMGGTITCESTEGAGTRFTVRLGLKPAVPTETDTEPAETETVFRKGGFSGMKVLVAEDNAINREIAERFINETGAEVTQAENGAEAIKRFTESPEGYYDIIFMDLLMPEKDGYEATRAIRRTDRSDASAVPIYAVTANAFEDDVARAKEAGMNGHISKPYSPEDIYKALAEARKKRGQNP